VFPAVSIQIYLCDQVQHATLFGSCGVLIFSNTKLSGQALFNKITTFQVEVSWECARAPALNCLSLASATGRTDNSTHFLQMLFEVDLVDGTTGGHGEEYSLVTVHVIA